MIKLMRNWNRKSLLGSFRRRRCRTVRRWQTWWRDASSALRPRTGTVCTLCAASDDREARLYATTTIHHSAPFYLLSVG